MLDLDTSERARSISVQAERPKPFTPTVELLKFNFDHHHLYYRQPFPSHLHCSPVSGTSIVLREQACASLLPQHEESVLCTPR